MPNNFYPCPESLNFLPDICLAAPLRFVLLFLIEIQPIVFHFAWLNGSHNILKADKKIIEMCDQASNMSAEKYTRDHQLSENKAQKKI